MISFIAKKICSLLGWSISDLPKGSYIYAAYPHTNFSDAIFCILAGVSHNRTFYVVVKETWNKPILKNILKLFYMLPIERNSKGLDLIIQELKSKEQNIVISIEGSRKLMPGIKPGFHNISKIMNMQIVPSLLDRKNKKMFFLEPFDSEDTAEKTIQKMGEIVKPYLPLSNNPELESPFLLYKKSNLTN